jgi:hypothetical protein
MSASSTDFKIYHKITGVGHWFTFTIEPPKFWRNGVEDRSTRESAVSFKTELLRDTAFCCLYSTLHYWIYQARTNCRDFNPSDIRFLPVPKSFAEGVPEFRNLRKEIVECLERTSEIGVGNYAVGGAVEYQRFRPGQAKPILDKVDSILAQHYGFTDEELDFIINYDIKYRLGQDSENEGE